MNNTYILLITFSGLLHKRSEAQEKIHLITPLHSFMQVHTDSTIVLEFTSNWLSEPNYMLLSKKGDTITLFTYRDLNFPSAYRTQIPSKIRAAMNMNRIWAVPVNVNKYLEPRPLGVQTATRFWAEVALSKPWQLSDDSKNGEGCPPVKQKDGITRDLNIYDGGGIRLYLITKDAIKILDYYAPDFYEKNCPGRADRVAVLKIAELFKSLVD